MRNWNGSLNHCFIGEQYDLIFNEFETYDEYEEFAKEVIIQAVKAKIANRKRGESILSNTKTEEN